MVRSRVLVLALLLVSACAAGHGGDPRAGVRWDGRRGYDGRGDYGYDLGDAPRAEAAVHRARASRYVPAPGGPVDPWGPYIREAAARHAVPEPWIREVMRQESGGRAAATSPAGAMGLMQVMPGTYDALRRRHGLGDDPYEPRDNILAGAAYLREMHDRFGAPAFLAAYNAGPERVEAVLAGATVLPDETLGYLARVAPRLGMAAELPLPAVAQGWRRGDGVYAGTYGNELAAADPADRAFDGGGLVTPWAPTGERTGRGTGSGT
ncbi:MAG: lytic transglycosylase domain-containing protein [Acetobacteraceae bacterium]|nr:lytic transglycosylase domain-containing protein [Acetobacteraceae bacterium]